MAGGAFRQSEWDPKKILRQIATMQLLFYLVSSAVWLFIAMLTGRTFSVDTLLSWEVAVRAFLCLTARGSVTDRSRTYVAAQPCTLYLQVEGADAQEKADARGAGGGRQESWAVGMVAGLAIAAVCGLALVPVVGRAKQCWDFAATVYILHMVACSCYTRFPMVIGLHFVVAHLVGSTHFAVVSASSA